MSALKFMLVKLRCGIARREEIRLSSPLYGQGTRCDHRSEWYQPSQIQKKLQPSKSRSASYEATSASSHNKGCRHHTKRFKSDQRLVMAEKVVSILPKPIPSPDEDFTIKACQNTCTKEIVTDVVRQALTRNAKAVPAVL